MLYVRYVCLTKAKPDNPIFSSERMLHQDYDCKGSVGGKKIWSWVSKGLGGKKNWLAVNRQSSSNSDSDSVVNGLKENVTAYICRVDHTTNLFIWIYLIILTYENRSIWSFLIILCIVININNHIFITGDCLSDMKLITILTRASG
jgi:hypothetical protein